LALCGRKVSPRRGGGPNGSVGRINFTSQFCDLYAQLARSKKLALVDCARSIGGRGPRKKGKAFVDYWEEKEETGYFDPDDRRGARG